MASDSIGNALSLQARLQADLQRKGVAADKASLVASDVDSALKSAQTTAGGRVDRVSARSAIEQRLNDDVASGKLSTDDATLVRKTLDEFDKRARQGGPPPGGGAGGPPPGGGAGGPPPGGGGGGAKSASGSSSSDSSTKTEVQRTSSTTGGATTTTITYADGSTETKTTYGASSSKSGGDELVDLLKSLSTQKDSSKAESYLKDLLASDLVDFYA